MNKKTWLIFISIFILALLATNFSAIFRIYRLNTQLNRTNKIPIDKNRRTKPVNKDYQLIKTKPIIQQESSIKPGAGYISLDNLVRQAEIDISDLSQQGKQSLKNMYQNMDDRRYSSIALEIGN